ncbi:MAG TPA: acyltransferase family protein [Kiloniellales bacterium]|nr:acyltransferase family protein [Kiloniellales bacterium]
MGSRLSAERPPLPYRLLGLPRFALALLVLLYHALPVADLNDPALYATDFGPVAVFVFFVLSGYIITEAALAFYAGRPFAFAANRLLRLWPAYLAALAAMAFVLWLTGRAEPGQLSAANLAANALALFPSVVVTDPLLGLSKRGELLPIVWALRVEFAFYFVVVLALLAGRLGARTLWIVPLCWLALAGNLAFYHLDAGDERATFYFGMAPYFVLGAVWALRTAGGLPQLLLDPLLPPALLLAALHAYSFDAFDADAVAWERATGAGPFLAAALFLLLLAWCLLRLRREAARAPAQAATDRLLGNLTYELYLVHLPVAVLVAWLWPTPAWSSLLVVLALSLAAAALLASLLGAALRPLRRRVRRAATPTLA